MRHAVAGVSGLRIERDEGADWEGGFETRPYECVVMHEGSIARAFLGWQGQSGPRRRWSLRIG